MHYAAWGAGALLFLLALAALFRGLERETLPKLLELLAQPYLELNTRPAYLSQGEKEYLVLPKEAGSQETRERFLARHPGVRYLSPGSFFDTLVVAVKPPLRETLRALRDDDFVSMVINNDASLLCH